MVPLLSSSRYADRAPIAEWKVRHVVLVDLLFRWLDRRSDCAGSQLSMFSFQTGVVNGLGVHRLVPFFLSCLNRFSGFLSPHSLSWLFVVFFKLSDDSLPLIKPGVNPCLFLSLFVLASRMLALNSARPCARVR